MQWDSDCDSEMYMGSDGRTDSEEEEEEEDNVQHAEH